jgi:tetratricopeptide (TPR) repeat protein
MVEWLNAREIPVLVSTVVGNYSDWEPNRSIFCEQNHERRDFKRRMEEGDGFERLGRLEQAVEAYRSALEICPRFAETHYRLGKTYESLGRQDEAWKAFLLAVKYDGMPVRALPAQNDFVRELGASGKAYVVDAEEAFHVAAGSGSVGFNLMVDGHHPNETGYGLIAELMARKIAEIFAIPDEQLDLPDAAEIVAFFGWERPSKAFRLHVGRGRWFSRLATWRHDPRARLDKAEENFLRAREIARSRYESHLGMAVVHYLRGDAPAGDDFLATAMEQNAGAVRKYVERPWVESVIRRAREAD